MWVHNPGPCPIPWITPGSLAEQEGQAVDESVSHIDQGLEKPSWANKWGEAFKNREGLPAEGGPYREFYVRKAPGDTNPWGLRRIVMGSDGRMYYTWDHYHTFVRIR